MSLSIKNKEAYQLARELAQLTGQSMTAIVVNALRKERNEVTRQQHEEAKLEELMAIADRCAAHLDNPGLAVDHGDMLYDELGMPK